MREKVQQMGGFMAHMIIPNLGAFIAWGLITAFFIPTGWTPNETLAKLVGPMIVYLLPILIGFAGGKLVYDVRGGVVGAAATMGVIVGTDVPMFIGAMIMGPLAGYLIKKLDELWEEKIPIGFELLVNNFSAGILAAILAIIGNLLIGPVVEGLSNALGAGVQVLIDNRMLPLAHLFIEPAKVLFLNNAINHGILAPLGVAQAKETGRSVLFMLETNPGPGLGVLLAFWFAGKGMVKESAPGAIIIHFFGGIHEIFFPYILAHPVMLIAQILGGMAATLWFIITGAGLVATPSPGSIFAYLAVTPPGQHFSVLVGILIAAVVSFAAGTFILKIYPVKDVESEEELDEAAVRHESGEMATTS
jgi:PTS system mannitol-specific IIC component